MGYQTRIKELEERVNVLEQQIGILNEGLIHENHNLDQLIDFQDKFINRLVEIGLIRIEKKLTMEDIIKEVGA